MRITFALQRYTRHVTSARESNGKSTINGNLKGNTCSYNKAKTICTTSSNGLESIATISSW